MVFTLENLELAKCLFNLAYFSQRTDGDSKRRFYCGITDNLDRRMGEHNTNYYSYKIECDSFDTAKEMERILHDEGYYTGRQLGHGNDNTVFVYMYKRIEGVTIDH